MAFELAPEFDSVTKRYQSWWECEIIDRPLISISLSPNGKQSARDLKNHGSWRETWLDTEYQVQKVCERISKTVYLADALPVCFPNLGPDVFASFYGSELRFSETTVWSDPIFAKPESFEIENLKLNNANDYYTKLIELTDALLQAAKGKFIVGQPDWHPGGDTLAALRDPQHLCIDLLEGPETVKSLCTRVTEDFLHVYDAFHEKFSAAGMPSTGWLPAICTGKYHIPSNDFSCMISNRHFEEIFLPGLITECRHMAKNIYHLDGPNALRHLDTLLEQPEIHAIQWVPGAGHDRWTDWISVYHRVQQAKKALTIKISKHDLELLRETLRPEGLWITVGDVVNRDEAEQIVKKLSKW